MGLGLKVAGCVVCFLLGCIVAELVLRTSAEWWQARKVERYRRKRRADLERARVESQRAFDAANARVDCFSLDNARLNLEAKRNEAVRKAWGLK